MENAGNAAAAARNSSMKRKFSDGECAPEQEDGNHGGNPDYPEMNTDKPGCSDGETKQRLNTPGTKRTEKTPISDTGHR